MAKIPLEIEIQSNIQNALQRIAPALSKIERQLEGLSQESEQFGRSFKNAGKSVSKTAKTIGGGISTIAKATAAAATAIGSVGIGIAGFAVKAASDIQQLELQFQSFTGSAASARKQVEELANFTARTPFRLEEVAQAGRSLLAFGNEQQRIIPLLEQLGNVAAATGSDLGELTTIFGQIQAAGKLTGERFNQLVERGINIGPALAQTLGVGVNELEELRRKGEITAQDVEEAFTRLAGPGGQFAGAIDRLSGSTEGLFSTLQDNIQLTLAEIGRVLQPIFASLLQPLINVFKNLSQIFKNNQDLIFDIFKELFQDIVDIVQQATKFLTDNAETIVRSFKFITNGASALAKGVKVAFDSVLLVVSDLIVGVAKGRKALGDLFGIDLLSEGADETIALFSEFSKELTEDIITTSKSISKNLNDAFTVDAADRQLITLGKEIGEAIQAGAEQGKEAIKGLKKELSAGASTQATRKPTQQQQRPLIGFDFINPAEITNVTAGLGESLASAGEVFSNSVIAVSGFLSGNAQQLASVQDALATTQAQFAASTDIEERRQLGQQLVELKKQEAEASKEAAFNTVQTLAGAIPVFGDAIAAVLDLLKDPDALVGIINGLTDALPDIIDGLIDAIPDVVQALIDSIPKVVATLVEKIPDLIVALIQALPGLITAIVEQIPVIIRGFVDALPEIIDAIIDAIPDIIEGIITNLPAIILALVEAIPKVVLALSRGVIEAIPAILNGFARGITKALQNSGIGEFFGGLFESFEGLADVFQSVADIFYDVGEFFEDLIGGGGDGGTLSKFGSVRTFGEGVSDLFGGEQRKKILGFATGGFVTGAGNRDTVPALLSPGELVVDRTTGPQLREFLDNQQRQPTTNTNNEVTNALLNEILGALKQPQTTQVQVMLDRERLADALFEMQRDNLVRSK